MANCTAPQMIPTAYDPQTGNDPQIEPQMIPNRKWSRRNMRDGMEFGFLEFFNFLF